MEPRFRRRLAVTEIAGVDKTTTLRDFIKSLFNHPKAFLQP